MEEKSSNNVDICDKVLLTFKEASKYFGVGEKTLKNYISHHMDPEFVVRVGKSDIRIKRRPFQKHIEEKVSRM
ncbi:MAG: helix-turn-helix domain-containing protein [Firmicutes bacterium]|nr:helix-turn-helix domain-containing protein [Bacillota bacterium]